MCEDLFGDDGYVPARAEDWPEFAALARRWAQRQRDVEDSREGREILEAFAERLESQIAERGQAKGEAAPGSKKKPAGKKRPKKTKPKRRKPP